MIENIPNAEIIKYSDWNRVKLAVEVVWNNIQSGKWEHRKTYDKTMASWVYSMDEHGSFMVSLASDHTRWIFWAGQWLEELLPWTKIVRKKLQEANLPISSIAYHNHTFSVPAHKDSAYQGGLPELPHTNVNYMISSVAPDKSFTWCKDEDGNEMRYYSHPGSLWIINASCTHAVETTGFRDALIIKFRHPFDMVSDFFKKNPDFFDANQPYFQS